MLKASPMPGVTITRTSRPITFRLYRLCVLAWCWFEIRSIEDWIDACAADRILESDQLDGCRAKLEELRALQSTWRNA